MLPTFKSFPTSHKVHAGPSSDTKDEAACFGDRTPLLLAVVLEEAPSCQTIPICTMGTEFARALAFLDSQGWQVSSSLSWQWH